MALDELVTDAGGSCRAVFEFEEETWSATLETRGSGLCHPGRRLPTGVRFPIGEMREFNHRIESEEDALGERYFNVHVRPRWQGMEAEGETNPSVPHSVEEGVNLDVEGSNIEYNRYQPLIRSAVAAVGLDESYFEAVHETSTVYAGERNVRVHNDKMGPLIGRDGPLQQLWELVLNDREGSRRPVWSDTDGYGNNVPGYYITLPLGPTANEVAFPDHTYSTVIKLYHSRETVAHDDSDCLAHPKLGVMYRNDKGIEKVCPTDEGLARLKQEQEEKLLMLLKTAGLPLRHEFGTYVEDAYFEPTTSERDLAVAELDLDRVRESQEALVIQYLADGFSPVERESLEVLVSEDDNVSPQAIAE